MENKQQQQSRLQCLFAIVTIALFAPTFAQQTASDCTEVNVPFSVSNVNGTISLFFVENWRTAGCCAASLCLQIIGVTRSSLVHVYLSVDNADVAPTFTVSLQVGGLLMFHELSKLQLNRSSETSLLRQIPPPLHALPILRAICTRSA